jgi:transcriptional regulator NrdR family protein
VTQCPQVSCGSAKVGVVDSRDVPNGVRRRRACSVCGTRWTTYEVPAEVFALISNLDPKALDAAADALALASQTMERVRSQAKLIKQGNRL